MRPDTTPFSLIAEWLPQQRWFAGKATEPTLRLIGSWDLPQPGMRIRTHLLMDESGRTPVLYQVPVTERPEPLAGADNALIGVYRPESNRASYLYDGPHDPRYAEALLRMIMQGDSAVPDGAEAGGVAFQSSPPRDVVSSSVLTGEQSNTSIIYELGVSGERDGTGGAEGTERVICKVFRTLHHGENPDVVLQSALAGAGSQVVPHPIGAVVGEWDDIGRDTGRARGHLAFAQEFISGAEDGWRIALRAAAAESDFTASARALGVLTAEIHSVLASVLPTREPAGGDIDAAIDSWQQRLDLAADEVPAVAEHRPWIEEVYRATRGQEWPRVQRIHGDFHLGQVLATPDGRWIALDFEGEPLRPMVERGRLDYALRDVAGMLRSFDYAARHMLVEQPDDPQRAYRAQEWAARNRAAYCTGYSEASGLDPCGESPLLRAFEADKAVYECVYEARNRPHWLMIPLNSLSRLTESG
jgi:predicted trehalose synthase